MALYLAQLISGAVLTIGRVAMLSPVSGQLQATGVGGFLPPYVPSAGGRRGYVSDGK